MNDRQITDMKKLFNLLLMCHKLPLLSPPQPLSFQCTFNNSSRVVMNISSPKCGQLRPPACINYRTICVIAVLELTCFTNASRWLWVMFFDHPSVGFYCFLIALCVVSMHKNLFSAQLHFWIFIVISLLLAGRFLWYLMGAWIVKDYFMRR